MSMEIIKRRNVLGGIAALMIAATPAQDASAADEGVRILTELPTVGYNKVINLRPQSKVGNMTLKSMSEYATPRISRNINDLLLKIRKAKKTKVDDKEAIKYAMNAIDDSELSILIRQTINNWTIPQAGKITFTPFFTTISKKGNIGVRSTSIRTPDLNLKPGQNYKFTVHVRINKNGVPEISAILVQRLNIKVTYKETKGSKGLPNTTWETMIRPVGKPMMWSEKGADPIDYRQDCISVNPAGSK